MIDINKHFGLVHHLVNKHIAQKPYLEPWKDDILQEGMIALHRAARLFKPERKNQFSTYACKVIFGQIRDAERLARPYPADHDERHIRIESAYEVEHDVLALRRFLESRLTQKDVDIYFSYHLQGLTYAQIQQRYGIHCEKARLRNIRTARMVQRWREEQACFS